MHLPRAGVAAVLALAVGTAACGTVGPTAPAATAAPGDGSSATAAPVAASPAASPVGSLVAGATGSAGPAGGATAFRVVATRLPARLPNGLSRAVAMPDGPAILLLGGLTSRGSTAAILRLDPATGTVAAAGRLAAAVHDAAGAPVPGAWLVIGGGRTVAVPTVQRVTLAGAAPTPAVTVSGQLPAARADQAAAGVPGAGVVVVAGGGRGGVADPRILETSDGGSFRTVGRLPLAVRYAAAAALGGRVYLLGGTTATGDTAAIQVIDPATGAARVGARLPVAVTQATAFVLGGRILLAGGMRGGRPVDSIWAFDPATRRTTLVGRLPAPAADAAVAVIGDTAYLLGGETGTAYLDTIVAVRLAS